MADSTFPPERKVEFLKVEGIRHQDGSNDAPWIGFMDISAEGGEEQPYLFWINFIGSPEEADSVLERISKKTGAEMKIGPAIAATLPNKKCPKGKIQSIEKVENGKIAFGFYVEAAKRPGFNFFARV